MTGLVASDSEPRNRPLHNPSHWPIFAAGARFDSLPLDTPALNHRFCGEVSEPYSMRGLGAPRRAVVWDSTPPLLLSE